MRQGFRDQLITAGAVDPAIGVMGDMFIPIHQAPVLICRRSKLWGFYKKLQITVDTLQIVT